ncbi:hypothetical protein FALBO_5322 [Fusarium albosuccineum]|uniref:LITAF domain-containing protein n=1 Tax=Fusarium albosuccineum TaxID=1237068 RepID=A0A8H4LGT8_9HYPO|nr:hypothetical protein FALBO_5322 [Fusarium albosuccineum]
MSERELIQPPPSYNTATGGYDEKIPAETAPGGQRPPQRAKTLHTVVHDGGLPEVVTSDHFAKETGNYDSLPEVVTTEHLAKRSDYYDAPIPVEPDEPPPMPPRHYQQQQQQQQQHYQHQQHVYDNGVTVTPLHLLGEQSDVVDCPFCKYRVETKVKKSPSSRTHVAATVLGFATIGGAVAPYACGWGSHLSHYCTNCDRKVAHRRYGTQEMVPMGTPEHLRQIIEPEAAVLIEGGEGFV